MSVAASRRARKRIILRYRGPSNRSVAESMEYERRKAAREQASKKKK